MPHLEEMQANNPRANHFIRSCMARSKNPEEREKWITQLKADCEESKKYVHKKTGAKRKTTDIKTAQKTVNTPVGSSSNASAAQDHQLVSDKAAEDHTTKRRASENDTQTSSSKKKSNDKAQAMNSRGASNVATSKGRRASKVIAGSASSSRH
jgi:CHASE3 domain sensor protein